MDYPLYNDDLCPDIWDKTESGYSLKNDVQETLSNIAYDFIDEYVKREGIELTILDILLVGSAANYNWTEYSDLDLHILVNYSELGIGEEYSKILMFLVKDKWNKNFSIEVKGHPVEIYAQDSGEKLESEAIFSVKNKKWVEEPEIQNPKFDKQFIKKNHAKWAKKIKEAIASCDDKKISDVKEELHEFRKKGLAKSGEFSGENIVFKILRSQGMLDKMKEKSVEAYDQEMTLKESVNEIPLADYITEGVAWGYEPKKQKHRWSVPYNATDNTQPLEEEKEEDHKVLFNNEWVSLWTKPCPNSDGPYVYSHETRNNGNIIAVLLWERTGKDGYKYGLREEITPCWSDKPILSALTGGVDEGSTPIETAIKEVQEESGYICTKDDLKPLGTCYGTKSSDTVYTLYALDTRALKKGEPTGEDIGKIVWLNTVEAKRQVPDAIWHTMYCRNGSW
jgi:predicted nucleotidyltransferase